MAQEGKHLKDAEKGKVRHRGRKVALVCVIVVLVAAAGGGFAWWHWQGGAGQASGDAEVQTSENAADATGTTTEAEPEVANATAAASSDQSADDSQQDGQSDADASSDEDAADSTEEQTHQPGEHGAFTDEDLATMESLKGQISVSGASDGFADSDGYRELLYQVAVWQRTGYALGFALTDLGSGARISYNVDQVFYPASSIKAPFVCSLYEELVENGTSEAALDPVAENTIVNSDNDAFRSLHATYGESAFATWLQAAGVPATAGHGFSYFTQYYYPQISTAQLDLMWTEIYRYCTSGTAPSQTLASYLSQRTTSPIADAVGNRYGSWGKAGWYYSSGDYGAEPATVDAGIVFADSHPYRLVMMSNAPGMLDQMADLAAGMDAAAAALVG